MKFSTYSLSLTHSMAQDIIWKAECHSAEGSLPCSPEPVQFRGPV